jgi:hypothetical protein
MAAQRALGFPSGGLGFLLIIVIVLVVTGRIQGRALFVAVMTGHL